MICTFLPPVLGVRWSLFQPHEGEAGRAERQTSYSITPFLFCPVSTHTHTHLFHTLCLCSECHSNVLLSLYLHSQMLIYVSVVSVRPSYQMCNRCPADKHKDIFIFCLFSYNKVYSVCICHYLLLIIRAVEIGNSHQSPC